MFQLKKYQGLNKLSIKNIFSLFKETYQEWNSKEPFELSAVIAYYAIFSLPGLLIIVIGIAGFFFGEQAVKGEVANQISKMLGKEAANGIQEMIVNSYKSNSSLMATIIGVATLLFGATGVFFPLQKSLNKLWNVKADPKAGIKKLILDRATSFGIILALGFLLLVSLVLTTILSVLSNWISHVFPEFMLVLFIVLNFIVSFGFITILFALIFKVLPDVKIRWKPVWIGSIVTAVLFEIGRFALEIYFAKANPGSTYGAAGSVILILLWVSYSCMILFFGAEFTQVYARRAGDRIEPSENAVPTVDRKKMREEK
jgi:membrane protein